MRTVVVVAGGDPIDVGALAGLPEAATVVAADSGIDLAHAIGLHVDVAVGDFDSVLPATLAQLEAAGATTIERHRRDKDASDLDLALDAARRAGAGRVVVLGGHGGRLDHLVANALLLAAPHHRDLRIEARMGGATVTVVTTTAPGELRGAAGDLVSLLAAHGAADGVVTEGLRFALRGERLEPGSSRGLSNELVGDRATVGLTGGAVLAIQPGSTAST